MKNLKSGEELQLHPGYLALIKDCSGFLISVDKSYSIIDKLGTKNRI